MGGSLARCEREHCGSPWYRHQVNLQVNVQVRGLASSSGQPAVSGAPQPAALLRRPPYDSLLERPSPPPSPHASPIPRYEDSLAAAGGPQYLEHLNLPPSCAPIYLFLLRACHLLPVPVCTTFESTQKQNLPFHALFSPFLCVSVVDSMLHISVPATCSLCPSALPPLCATLPFPSRPLPRASHPISAHPDQAWSRGAKPAKRRIHQLNELARKLRRSLHFPLLPCSPVHPGQARSKGAYQARHGAREPTKRRVHQLNELAPKLRRTFAAASIAASRKSVAAAAPVPPDSSTSAVTSAAAGWSWSLHLTQWMRGYRSPWEGMQGGGELLTEGEEELYRMGGRFRRRFPSLLGGVYHSKAVKLFSTQVARSAASAVAFAILLLENSVSLTRARLNLFQGRSAASAVAFAIGLLEGSGSLTPARLRAFPVISETQEGDTKLRFHNLCGAYVAVKENAQGRLDEGWEDLWGEIAQDINKQLGLVSESPEAQKREEGVRGEVAGDGNEQLGLGYDEGLVGNGMDGQDAAQEAAGVDLTAYDVSGLWLQCKHEAGVLLRGGGGDGREGADEGDHQGSASRACGLFSARHLAVLEWIDDVDTFMQKGYGREINYHMGLNLLQELSERMVNARLRRLWEEGRLVGVEGERVGGVGRVAGSGKVEREEGKEGEGDGRVGKRGKKGKKGKKEKDGWRDGVRERAALHFGHAETVIPFACLLGLYKPESPDEGVTKEDERAHKQADKQEQQQQQQQKEGPLRDKYDVLMAKVAATITQQFAPPVPLPPAPPSHRRWQASQIAPYAANTAVILFRCGPHESPDAASSSCASHGGDGGGGGSSGSTSGVGGEGTKETTANMDLDLDADSEAAEALADGFAVAVMHNERFVPLPIPYADFASLSIPVCICYLASSSRPSGPLCVPLCPSASQCGLLRPNVAFCVPLCPSASQCGLLRPNVAFCVPSVPLCVPMWPSASLCAPLPPFVPLFLPLCPSAFRCAPLRPSVPLCLPLYPSASLCVSRVSPSAVWRKGCLPLRYIPESGS
ncbi:unnamed protein product [Closterium sp. NIES-65]|nr:unnamed protein product [Closterium sp. NIES-65]